LPREDVLKLLRETNSEGFLAGAKYRKGIARHAKRIVIKVGTAVVSHQSTGYVAIGRLAHILEQVAELHHANPALQVMIVTSGALACGTHELRSQMLAQTTPSSLASAMRKSRHGLQAKEDTGDFLPEELIAGQIDARAAASAGQGVLVTLYSTLCNLLDMKVSQILVTEADFRVPMFRQRLSRTLNYLLDARMIPIINENDAISVRTAPVNGEEGIFWDNDSLAALIAREVDADLLLILSDVDGLYTGPVDDPASVRLPVYSPIVEEHIGFGAKSKVGRGGMQLKLSAAWRVTRDSQGSCKAIVASGYRQNEILRVVRDGEDVGTLFSLDCANMLAAELASRSAARSRSSTPLGKRSRAEAAALSMVECAAAARQATRTVATLPHEARVAALRRLAEMLRADDVRAQVLEANAEDLVEARKAKLAGPLLARLKLTEKKLDNLAAGADALADMDDPVGRLLTETELSPTMTLRKVTAPLGVLLIIFESRPDAFPQVASLIIASGNAALLKGGKEAVGTCRVLADVVAQACGESGLPTEMVQLVEDRASVAELLAMDSLIDLVIPRGSSAMVRSIMDSTRIPVMGHAEGVCHIYVHGDADLSKAQGILLDAKLGYPAACNAMETLLLDSALVHRPECVELLNALAGSGIVFHPSEAARQCDRLRPLFTSTKTVTEFRTEYGTPECTVHVVSGADEAAAHVNAYSSGHTDSILTNSDEVASAFLQAVDSASVFHNASTRFADGFRFGLGAEVGISTSRIHARGPVGVDGLLTTKFLLRSSAEGGDAVAEYEGDAPTKKYTHVRLH
jgi:delta-1-pyrroline-5-carboxylate synthetase